MKFYGSGVVWDSENQRALVEFGKECFVETEDERTIKLLTDAKYEKEAELTKKEIMVQLDDQGIEYNSRDSKDTLLALLRGE